MHIHLSAMPGLL